MNTMARSILAATCFAAAGTTACRDLPTTADAANLEPQVGAASEMAARRFADEDLFDMNDYIMLFPCNAAGEYDEGGGEPVRMYGAIHSSFVAVTTSSDNVQVNYRTMPVGLGGVGVQSGEEFRVREAEHANSIMTRKGYTESYRYTLTMVGRDTGRRALLRFAAHFRVTDDHQVIVDRQLERMECSSPAGP